MVMKKEDVVGGLTAETGCDAVAVSSFNQSPGITSRNIGKILPRFQYAGPRSRNNIVNDADTLAILKVYAATMRCGSVGRTMKFAPVDTAVAWY